MNSALTDIGMTIVQPLFSLAMLLIAVRFLAQLCGVSGYNPISMTLRRVTNVIVLPLSRLCQVAIDSARRAARTDTHTGGVYRADARTSGSIGCLQCSASTHLERTRRCGLLVSIIFYSVIAMIVVSFLAPQSSHPAVDFIWELTEPVMAPLRQFLPPMGGLDFSPIILFIALNVIRVSLGHMAVAVGMPRFVIGI